MELLEIHVLDVGCAEAILVVRTNGQGEHVTLIDGGNAEDGPTVVAAVRAYTKGSIDLLVNTHPDKDHLGGLFHVIESLPVAKVLMHDPGVVLDVLGSYFRGVTIAPVADYAAAFERGVEFAALVDRSGVRREAPVVGAWPAPHVRVLGPTPQFYAQTMLGLARPIDLILDSIQRGQDSLSQVMDAKDDLSPLNQTSIVVCVGFQGRAFLFTGDANVAALSDLAVRWDLRNIFWLQVPHHGSKRNLSSELIRTISPAVAVVSAGTGDRKHPSRAVLNGFEKVGTPVVATMGAPLSYRSDGVIRPGYVPAAPINRPILAPPAHALPT